MPKSCKFPGVSHTVIPKTATFRQGLEVVSGLCFVSVRPIAWTSLKASPRCRAQVSLLFLKRRIGFNQGAPGGESVHADGV